MRAFIQCNKNYIPYNKNAYTALEGFNQMGVETILFHTKEELSNSTPEDIIVGGVGRVKERLEQLGIAVNDIDYPTELENYFGRKIWAGNISDLLQGKIEYPVFVKPMEGKLFSGCLALSDKDLIGKAAPGTDFPVYYSEPLKIETEFRCYIRYNQILDIKRYKGTLNTFYNYDTICSAVKDYTTAPAAYAMDFGVTDSGATILVEVNDGYSLGNYGLDSLLYAKLLSARWAELTNTIDECNF